MRALANIKALKKDMEIKKWVIDSFMFTYKDTDYIVLVKLYEQNESRPKYALVKMEFLKVDDITNNLEAPANSNSLMVEPKVLRNYFGIEYASNLGDILQEFSKYLGAFIPTEVLNNKNDMQKRGMVSSLCKSDSENPNKIYCYMVRRNSNKADGTPGQRSPYNDNVTRIRRPALYEKLHKDTSLSFCYSEDSTLEKSDEEIIKNWASNNSK
ncbi:hypothetical protein FDC62_06070 [Clostridium botulinum]|uniref:DUF6037 family protein n=1 Tax=Clostridium botulinum TaxID=1491 RepID=UPI00052DDA08|nr:DUF6037 family protein [Clostridium botulinum]KGM94333.1 hypothetical protein Z956_08055 [Clostridium botulinum D str. CCUG 7971]NFO97775.1 hypothetical protein [Clostridium botulinum]OOV51057.1 hypothetical protein B1A66_11170 [Clostridium botulinum D/C]OOV53945.1 hypothetical protein B1A67_11835 [Clostridium botulinum D/C]OOV54958.1 hypothetical protein B0673_09450 [Clostridium botulinum D/C]